MAQYNQGELLGVVGYDEVYRESPNKPELESLLKGIPRIWAVRLVSNIQNKLVGIPFYNPHFDGKSNLQIDAPRFFLGPENQFEMRKVVEGYKMYLREKEINGQQPMLYSAASETPLFLLRAIMAMPESKTVIDMATLERNLFKAFLLANDATISRDHGDNPYNSKEEKELYLSTMMMSRFAYNDITGIQSELRTQLINQTVRCITLFEFLTQKEELKDIYFDFLTDYNILSWERYLCTYWSVVAKIGFNTGIIDFKRVLDMDHLLEESVIDRDSTDIHLNISIDDNIDYVAFRRKPFLKLGPRVYAIIDVGFVIDRIYNALFFELNNFWNKRHPENPDEFNRIFTTEYSEEFMLANTMKEVAEKYGWLALTDAECGEIVPSKRLSSPPDFYIRKGKDIILFEGKDVKIKKEIKADGTISDLLKTAERNFVGYYDDNGKYRLKGVGQLVRNAKRIQDGAFLWDTEAMRDCTIYLVLVLSDPRQVAAGWKNYLNRRMYEECRRVGVDESRIKPLILVDLGTLYIYKENFLKESLFGYMNRYLDETKYDENVLYDGDIMLNVMNQTMSFSAYMNGEKCLAGEMLQKKFLNAIRPTALEINDCLVTKTLVYRDLFDEDSLPSESYLVGIDKKWLIEGILHFISIDSFDSFSMRADKHLMMMFQNYLGEKDIRQLFVKVRYQERMFPNTYPTLINHQALYRLLRKVLLLPNDEGHKDCYDSYLGLLKALLAENEAEMAIERNKLTKLVLEGEQRDALIIMQQDLLNVNMFGTNINELEKTQILKFLVLCRFGKDFNLKIGKAINDIIKRNGFNNINSYILVAQMPFSIYHEPDHFCEGVLKLEKEDFLKNNAIRLWEKLMKYIADKCLDINEPEALSTKLSDAEFIDHKCFKVYPVLKISEDKYLVISQYYYALMLYEGFWWRLKDEMVPSIMSFEEFRNILSKDFFEKYLFCNAVRMMVKDKRINVLTDCAYPDCQSGADMLIATKKDIYFFEFKDMKVRGDIASGNDMDELMTYLDKRLNYKKSGSKEGNKGIPQLVTFMEDFFENKVPSEKRDYRKAKKKLHPILVINDRVFTVRGINHIMQEKFINRIRESDILKSHVNEIESILVMDYDVLLLTIIWCYHDFAEFQRILNGYMTVLKKAKTPIEVCNSFRAYVMALFEKEMKNPVKKRKFENGYKKVVNYLLKGN